MKLHGESALHRMSYLKKNSMRRNVFRESNDEAGVEYHIPSFLYSQIDLHFRLTRQLAYQFQDNSGIHLSKCWERKIRFKRITLCHVRVNLNVVVFCFPL